MKTILKHKKRTDEDVTRAKAILKRYEAGEIKCRRSHHQGYLTLAVGLHLRLVSIDGTTFELMTHNEYNKRLSTRIKKTVQCNVAAFC